MALRGDGAAGELRFWRAAIGGTSKATRTVAVDACWHRTVQGAGANINQAVSRWGAGEAQVVIRVGEQGAGRAAQSGLVRVIWTRRTCLAACLAAGQGVPHAPHVQGKGLAREEGGRSAVGARAKSARPY